MFKALRMVSKKKKKKKMTVIVLNFYCLRPVKHFRKKKKKSKLIQVGNVNKKNCTYMPRDLIRPSRNFFF